MPSDAGIALVVIAEDSALVTAYLEQLCESDPQIRIVGRARDGKELLELPELPIAKVVLLDLLMPELGGLSLVRRLSERAVVIAISSEEEGSALAREALALGAVAFFSKRSLAKASTQQELRRVIKQGAAQLAAARAQTVAFVVGSTGAIGPLEQIARALRGTTAPLLVVQHLPDGRAENLAHLLHHEAYPARVALHGDALLPGVFIAPAGKHMILDAQGRIALTIGEPVALHRPSGEVLLRSAARLGPRAVAVVLSGLGNDGALALGELAERGGQCFVQHPEDSHAPFMPRAAAAASPKVRLVREAQLGATLRKLLGDD
ncbi:MAG: response regulator [Myxococcales bacterium]|nr:MAG: response regulator [Myxococcales bacterium]